MKILFYDLETTGVNHWENGIIQLSGIVDQDGVEVARFNIDMQPMPGTITNPDTLKFHKMTEMDLQGRTPGPVALGLFKKHLDSLVDKYDKKDKMFLAGYNNAHFDNQFLRNFFNQNGDKFYGSYFWPNTIDVMVLATQKMLGKRTEMKNFKLSTVAMALGIKLEMDRLHDALYDVEITRQVYYALNKVKSYNDFVDKTEKDFWAIYNKIKREQPNLIIAAADEIVRKTTDELINLGET